MNTASVARSAIRSRSLSRRPSLAAVCALVAGIACGHGTAVFADDEPHAAHRRAMHSETNASETRVILPDVVLRDREGRKFALKPDAFGGKVVVVDFIFTRCTTICPALTSVMASVQRALGPQLGRDVVLVSISVDPANDTPQAMDAYAGKVGASEHWYWLTGNNSDIGRVLRAFGLSVGRPGDHPPLVLVGDPLRGRWTRWVGVPTPVTITQTARHMAGDTIAGKVDTHREHAHDDH
jgi:protein SCO1